MLFDYFYCKHHLPMSHLHERKEKVCLNCGANLIGRYCQDCGQENVEPKESLGHLITHFFNDVTHFDGKFFSSMKYLLLKPGFLTEEYAKGRRAAYLNPIRMYLFISAMFFLVLMTFFVDRAEHTVTTTKTTTHRDTTALRKGISAMRHTLDSLAVEQDSTETAAIDSALVKADAEPKNVHEYDSMQAALPKAKRDNFIDRYFNRRAAALHSWGTEHSKEAQHRMTEKFFHSMPYMLFISLPLIALLLKLLYVRRKQFYYVSHIIFLLHYYCIIFIAFFLMLFAQRLPYGAVIATSLLFIGYIVYLYFAMLRFYKQGWFKTFVKYFIFVFLAGFVVSILTLLLALNSIFNAVA